MNLKNFGNKYVAIPILVKCRRPLVASATTVAASSRTVASARVARTAGVMRAGEMAGCGTVRRGVVGTRRAKKTSDVVTGIIATIRSGAVVRPPLMASATLHSRHQQADQRRTADRDADCRQRIVHSFAPLRRGRLARRKKPRNDLYLSLNMATSFIDHSSEMWNFPCDRPLYPLSCSIRKVMP